MRLDGAPTGPPGIAAAVGCPPEVRSAVADGLAAGVLDDDEARSLGYASLAVSPDRSGPELAVVAANQAMAAAAWRGDSVDLVVHAWTYHQGHDFWSPAHFVANAVGAHDAIAVGVQQMCNGAVAAMEIAVTRMIADPGVNRCLVTTGDRFNEPGFDRWGSDVDVAYGDCGTAVLLDRTAAPHGLLSITTVSEPRYEVMHRGADAFSVAPGWHSDVIDVRRTKDAFTNSGEVARFKADQATAVRQVLHDAVTDVAKAAGDFHIRCVVLPRISAEVIDTIYLPAIADVGLGSSEALRLGHDTGHLGAGDASAGIAHVLSEGGLDPGEVALVLNVGGGFTWSCVAVSRR